MSWKPSEHAFSPARRACELQACLNETASLGTHLGLPVQTLILLSMQRRTFLELGLGTALASPLLAALREDKLAAAVEVLTKATASGQVHAAALYVRHGKPEFAKPFGAA